MGRKIIAITLREDLIAKIDAMVDNINVRSRSHAIEILLSRVLEKGKIESPKAAFVFAGGDAVKFNNREIPRAMISIVDKPILEYVINMLKKHNVKNIMISLGENGHIIKDYFERGDDFGVRITYIEEKSTVGNAGLLAMARSRLGDLFFAVNGDVFSDINLLELVNYHLENNCIATSALTRVEDPSGYDTVTLDSGKVVDFSPSDLKKERKESNIISPGIYILSSEIFEYISKDEQTLEKDVFPKLIKENKFSGHIFTGMLLDAKKYRQQQ